MNRLLSFALTVFTIVCVLVATERQAHAYVDPGSSFVVLQTFASVAAACGYFMRRRLKSLFGSKEEETTPSVPAKGNEGGTLGVK